MKKILFWTILSTIVLLGCTEQQQAKIDKYAADVNDAAQTIRQFGESPIGQLIPEDIKTLGLLLVIMAESAAYGWQAWRGSQMKKTTQAIVKGIEAAEQAANPTAAQAVKPYIKTAMELAGIYHAGDKIVDNLKTTK